MSEAQIESREHVELLIADGVTKDFTAVRALDDVSLAFRRGEIHGLIGENGAGKSTLMKILSGLERPTAGVIRLNGHVVEFAGPRDAMQRGVAMIHQELNLVDDLTVADNIFLGRERVRAGLIELRRTFAEAREWLNRLGADVDPAARVGTLSIAHKQLVEIAKAVSQDASILIMDEPTAVLSDRETESLFRLIRELRSRGVTIIYISHILKEILALCDRVTILRDGRVVTTLSPGEADEPKLARLMVGREMKDYFPPRSAAPAGPAALEVRGLSVPGVVYSVSFDVRPGEIVGLAGLVGAGRTEAAEAIAGLRPRRRGEIRVHGRSATIRRPIDAVRQGLAYLSEDRKGRGLVLPMSVVENTTLVSLRRYCARFFTSKRAERARTEAYIAQLGTRVGELDAPVSHLSGGNQQKVALAKWLDAQPQILILDEPTRGIDIGAKREIYQLIQRLAGEGKAIIFISSELPELLGMCHRIIVMRSGQVVGTLSGETATEERVMYLAAGVSAGAHEAEVAA